MLVIRFDSVGVVAKTKFPLPVVPVTVTPFKVFVNRLVVLAFGNVLVAIEELALKLEALTVFVSYIESGCR